MWQEAFILAKQSEALMDMIKLPYAEYLCKLDRFEDALKVYRKLNRPDLSSNIPVPYPHLRAHETGRNLVSRLLL